MILVLALGLPRISSFRIHNHLKDLGGFESGAGQEEDGRRDVASLDAHHVGVLVVAEVGRLAGLVQPWIPND